MSRLRRIWRDLVSRIAALVRAIDHNDDAAIEQAILRLSRSRRALAPLAFLVGAVVLMFDGVRLLVSNWRLTLVEILPAMWIWLAMYDLKAHVLHGKTLNPLRGPILIPIILAIIALTVASFALNAVFALAVAQEGVPDIRLAFSRVRSHWLAIVASGGVVGAALAFATMIVTRWGRPWFGLSLSVVVGVMMVCYVAVPARLIGVKPVESRRDKLARSAIGGALGATICTPPYLLGRLGLLMLGSKALLIPGIIVISIGVTLQAGATGAVRAVKLSASLAAGRRLEGAAQ